MKTIPNAIGSLLFVFLVIAVNGCADMGLDYRTPLNVSSLKTSLPPNPKLVLFRFDSTLPGVPLSETVWDNLHGAFADSNESEQIGFSLVYSPLIGVADSLIPNHTRIIIPFGRIFQEQFQSSLQTVFTNSVIFSDNSSGLNRTQPSSPRFIVEVVVKEFQVWEHPLNHINLKAVVDCTVFRAAGTDQPEFVYEAHREVIKESLGSVFQTPNGAIKRLNRITDGLVADLSEDILEKLDKAISE